MALVFGLLAVDSMIQTLVHFTKSHCTSTIILKNNNKKNASTYYLVILLFPCIMNYTSFLFEKDKKQARVNTKAGSISFTG